MIATTHPDRDHISRSAARMLLEIDAVHFRAEPFILTSGAASPVYIDCRKLISFPRIRSALMDYGVATVMDSVGFEAFDSVAGGETAGIPFSAWFAERMALPMQCSLVAGKMPTEQDGRRQDAYGINTTSSSSIPIYMN